MHEDERSAETETVTGMRGLERDRLTFEGQMEALGRLVGGVGNAKPWPRWFLRGVVGFMLLTTIIGLIVIVVVAITSL